MYKLRLPPEFRTGTVRKGSGALGGSARPAHRPGPPTPSRDPRASSSPRSIRDETPRAARDDDDATDEPVPRFDPNDTGVFPPRPPRAWTDAAHTRAMPERLMTRARGFDRAPGDAPAPGAAFDWVPTAEYEARHFVRPSTAEIPVRAPESTPLELFDDPELELKTPEQWLATRTPGGDRCGASSRYFTGHGQFTWEPCWVTGYDESSDTYAIEWRVSPGVTKRVKRLNLIFDAEDPDAFRTRLNAARLLRDRHERTLRYTRAADEIFEYSNDDLCDVPSFRAKISNACDGCRRNPVKTSTAPPGACDRFWAENLRVYRLAHKRSYLDLALRDDNKRARLAGIGVEPLDSDNERTNARGCAAFPGRHPDAHAIVQEEIAALLPDADADFLDAHQRYYANCDVRFETLLDVEPEPGLPEDPVTLDDFEKKQRTQLDRVSERMRGECVIVAVDILRELERTKRSQAEAAARERLEQRLAKLTPVERSMWMDANGEDVESNIREEASSELARATMMPRFLKSLTICAKDQVRTVVQNSVASYLRFWSQFAGGDAAVAGDVLHHLPFMKVTLTIKDGEVAYDPPLEKVKDVALNLFDDMVESVRDIPQIRAMLEATSQSETPTSADAGEGDADVVAVSVDFEKVPAPSADEPFVVEARSAIVAIVDENFIGPVALAESYRAFDELMVKPEPTPTPDSEPDLNPSVDGGAGAGGDADPSAEGEALAPTDAADSEAAPDAAGVAEDAPPKPEGGDGEDEEEEEAEPEAEVELTLEDKENEMRRLASLAASVDDNSESWLTFRLLGVSCYEIKATLMDEANARRNAMLKELTDEFFQGSASCRDRYADIANKLRMEVTNPEELDRLRRDMEKAFAERDGLQADLDACTALSEVLERAFHWPSLDEEVAGVYWEAMTWPSVITEIVAECEQRVKELTKKFKKELKADKETLSEDCHSARFEYNEFIRLGDIDAVEERLVRVEEIDAHHEALKERQELYASRQEIFGERGTRPKHLAELVKDFEPYANIWKTCAEVTRTVPEWIEGPFAALDPEKVSGAVEVWDRSTKKNLKVLDGPPREVGEALLAKIQHFQELLPLVVALRNPGLKDRHWAKLSEDLGFAVNGKDPNFTLQKALKLDLVAHIETVEKVSESASKEYSLERTLDKMQKDWSGVVFERKAWRETGSYILNATDEIQILLDDQVVKAMAMKASPYIGPFEDRAKQWEKTLLTIQEVLDSWLKCQNGWLYLEPIFGSDDIMQQMPTEGRKFKTVDVQYRKMMEKLKITADVVVVGADEELLNQLQQSNALLDDVNSGLSEYLETKRLAFPRFYFLSNDELLEILSETKDPLRVQPFLKKVFEAIHALEFQEDLEATAMISEEGEKVPFKNSFNPNTAGGQVEKWLTECEAAQRETVAEVCKHSSEAYATTKRTEWMIQWPGQVVLCIGSLYWTSETEEALRTGTMPEYAEKCTAQLMDIVELVRGQLTKLQRKTLSALVVIEVHARDVVAQLAKQGVASPDDFEWASQLRYTWDENEETGEAAVKVRMINAAVWYGNEYLGNSSRLVITPLTDRCYRTLMGAVHLDVGGAPEGPAGTGKTETTKDLAKAIAMQCVVFNCSDGLDYLAMAKFFKGLAASGAWACFDEFNRIDLEVLSVIAQQILTITRAKAAKLELFDFEGTRLPLRRTCNVFITMNPGYAGRSELPDNLKALFRTVAMMVPDYAMIGEIILYSFGYLEARDMARKLVATYKLCSEQLSSQSHYDYGMRAVISVLRAAGAVKLKFPDEDESVLMLISLKDVNLPKFLAPDIPLFNNILSDLFPGVVLPEPDYDHMRASVMKECAKANLQPTPVFMEKLFQLYEMILVRHGLMLVGYSYGAKTCIYQMLAGALNDLKAQNLLDENKVKIVVINPKSIYMGQLYGQFDPVSHEWQDGVLAKKFRECAVDTSPDRKWVMFDGPVDAIWIENMNTVLDDNKKLCLMSGEIIQMSGTMNMIFEVQDLAVASPATVSRCGMIYVEPSSMGWEPLKDSWMNTLPPLIEPHKPRIEELFTWLVKPCMAFVRKNCKELIPTSDINLPVALMNIFDSMIDEFRVELADGEDFDEIMAPKDQKIFVDCVFLFSVVWSIGGTTENEGREKFDFFLRKLVDGKVDPSPERTDFDLGPGLEIVPPTEKRVAKAFPKATEGSVYDMHFEKDKFRWTNWLKTVKDEPIREELEFQNIVVTTIDTIRYRYIFDVLATHGKHVLFGGPTGTGKTVYIKQALDAMDKDKWTNIQSTFSAQTNANQIQDIIDNKLDKRKKGVFGPRQGTRAVVFIDDLNMPMLEEYGAQPPIEIIRQWLDHGGWYDREELTMRKLVDIQFCAAMGPPGGGRNPVTPRMLRHFNQISICDFDDNSLRRVYTAITDWWCRRASVPKDVGLKLPGKLVEATLEIYNTIKRELLPTPMKSHYTYNMRDISKVWQGVSMIGEAPQNQLELIRLWSHETLRVFHDRLVNDEDRMWFFSFLKQMVDRHTGQKFDKVFAAWDFDKNGTVDIVELRRLMFASFMDGAGAEGKYAEVKDVDAMQRLVTEQLVEYNQSGKMRMDLVLFLYAAEHICRISRVIRQDLGNALLVGVGGSGRQSLTRIAAFMAEFEVYSIEITKSYTQVEWRDDLKNVLRKAGGEGSPTVFLFNDTQIKMESFLEDINNILNTGEVPNMFAKDETAQVIDMVTPRAVKAGVNAGSRADLFQFFVDECRRNLHMVLCFSPVGDAFRERLRKFPSLVNCCTIDWFSEWPEDALRSVASQFLKDITMDSDAIRDSTLDMCMQFHVDVRHLAEKFLANLGRYNYVTPTSYLELIGTYRRLLNEKRDEVQTMINRYEGGLAQIYEAEDSVAVMKTELIDLQPVLERTAVETEEIIKQVNLETVDADKVKASVAKDEAYAAEQAANAEAIKVECETELAAAIPVLESAIAALDTLTKEDITYMKAYKNPPEVVKLVMEAVCILLKVKPAMVKDPKGGVKKIANYWIPTIKLLGDSQFLDKLRSYDKDSIPNKIIKQIKPYVARPEFQPEKVKEVSAAAYGFCCWVRAMEAYDSTVKVVEPKKKKLAQAQEEYEGLMVGLNEARGKLKEVEDKVQALNDKLEAMQNKKAQLEFDYDMCGKKLIRAEKLIGGLGGEKERWKQVAAGLKVDYTNLTGDVLLCAGYIAYLGAFTQPYRDEVLGKWIEQCKAGGIPCSDTFKLITVLGEPVKIQQWAIDGLPNDSFSVDNAIVMNKSRRWPLIIDPQGQANKWIRKMEQPHNLVVVKLTDGDFIRKLENAIQFGNPVLLENVGEELDPTLEPLLLKSTFKQGGQMVIRLGDSTIEYHQDFRFYITTKYRNPHYLPEISVKVTLVNMMITIDGLVDQVLGIAVAKERPDLEEEKARLTTEGAENARQLAEVENKIIEVLGSSEGSILESETAIDVITNAKELSNEINRKQAIAKKTEITIDETREGYRPLAVHVAHLFFNVGELCNIEPMYQYSLAWYVNLFNHALEFAPRSDDLQKRLDNLIEYFTYSLYKNICRSLFEKDKLLFSFTLAATIFTYKGTLDPGEYRFLLTGGLGQKPGADDVPCKWLNKNLWLEMLRLSDLPAFDGFADAFRSNPDAWQHIYDSANPESEALPAPWCDKLDDFQKLIALRTVRPDKLTRAVQIYVDKSMGRRYIEPPPFDLEQCYNDSTCFTPLVFILSPGSDPMDSLLKFCAAKDISMETLSLGQGQGPKAEALIAQGVVDGSWVVLQNCHLAVSWMTTLDRICEEFVTNASPPHENFRLWLTSYPSPHFPVAVLQNGVKMTNEPPKGLRANMISSFQNDPISDEDFFEGCARPAEWKKLLVGLAFFHAYVQERRNFGPLGWNIPYGFNDPDLKISLRQLRMFLDEAGEDQPLAVPLKTLVYLIGECNYGGRVTDAHDRRCLMSILTDENGGPFHVNIMDDNYRFSPSGLYYAPEEGDHESYIEFFKQMPIAADPEVFGLHANADITKDQQETDLMCNSILLTQGNATSGGGKSKEETLAEVAAQIAESIPPVFDLELANYKYPVDYYESMNSVLCQELVRFNRLLEVIHASIGSFQLALKGQIVMTGELDALGNAMFDGKIPAMWAKKSYPSLQPLAAYMSELVRRLETLQKWIDEGAPPMFWITGFFFTHAFLTGVLQNYARKYKLPIDTVVFDFEAMPANHDFTKKPDDGAYCTGMFIEGAKWSDEKMTLVESDPKVLFTEMPVFWFKPTTQDKRADFPHYLCPIYRTAERRGVLATTGHSSNFVINLTVPSDKPQNHWIKRGVAGLLSLSY